MSASVTDIRYGRALRELDAAIEKYGVDVHGMGAAFARQEQERRLNQAVEDFRTLVAPGDGGQSIPREMALEKIRATLRPHEVRIFNGLITADRPPSPR